MSLTLPTAVAPTILEGEIYGPVRYEALEGGEYYELKGPVTRFTNFKPFERGGKTWFVTHLQKRSSYGWLKTDPDCFHWWKMIRLQSTDSMGNLVPGSECGVYFRKPFSWRFDVPGTTIEGTLQHWIRTYGYLGTHFD